MNLSDEQSAKILDDICTKKVQYLFVGGCRDGKWCEVDPCQKSVSVVPMHMIDEQEINETDGPEFKVERYTRRAIYRGDVDALNFFCLETIEDPDSFVLLIERYQGAPPVHSMGGPVSLKNIIDRNSEAFRKVLGQ